MPIATLRTQQQPAPDIINDLDKLRIAPTKRYPIEMRPEVTKAVWSYNVVNENKRLVTRVDGDEIAVVRIR